MNKKFILLSFVLIGTSGLMGVGSGFEERNRKIVEVFSKIENWGSSPEEKLLSVDRERELAEIKQLVAEVGPHTKAWRLNTKDQRLFVPFLVKACTTLYPVPKLVQTLLEVDGIDANASDRSGNTPLIMAARRGDEDIVKLLLVKGANPLLKNLSGQTALEHVNQLVQDYKAKKVPLPPKYTRTLEFLEAREGELAEIQQLVADKKPLTPSVGNLGTPKEPEDLPVKRGTKQNAPKKFSLLKLIGIDY